MFLRPSERPRFAALPSVFPALLVAAGLVVTLSAPPAAAASAQASDRSTQVERSEQPAKGRGVIGFFRTVFGMNEPAPEPPAPRRPETSARPARPARAVEPRVAAQPQAQPETRAFAAFEELELELPDAAVAVGFHESGTPGSLSLRPLGAPVRNENLPRMPQAPVSEGVDYMILPTRGRPNTPTSAIDVSMRPGQTVASPVTGTVVAANAYSLYGKTPDELVFVQPDARPDLVVVMMHLEGLEVQVGDRVESGTSPIARTARLLPFSSQIDQYAGTLPHMHVEVRPAA
jgi:murein DD-endopeptidase MepM/ murein hydrolase activator NlpD